MNKVIKVEWLESKHGDILVGGGRAFGSIHPKDGIWVSSVNDPVDGRVLIEVMSREMARTVVERRVGVVELQ